MPIIKLDLTEYRIINKSEMRCISPLPDIRTLNLKKAYKSSKAIPYEVCSWVNANMYILERNQKTQDWTVPSSCCNKETYDRVTSDFGTISPNQKRDCAEEIKNINKHIVLSEIAHYALNKRILKKVKESNNLKRRCLRSNLKLILKARIFSPQIQTQQNLLNEENDCIDKGIILLMCRKKTQIERTCSKE